MNTIMENTKKYSTLKHFYLLSRKKALPKIIFGCLLFELKYFSPGLFLATLWLSSLQDWTEPFQQDLPPIQQKEL